MPAEKEPSIIINGIELTTAQAMSVRNAISVHRSWLVENGLGNDQRGKDIAEGYKAHLGEVENIILYPPR
ncbi:hypothetical protein KKJ06_20525 [Xenorhabdus bovienii]|uniref:hypothetical protein n=1 Tax=Xenorhabdus bovienii TaxID=40576 RepID=UPI0023B2D4E9|nr:hypothetical protein [Xenorhabdus bovienii]MDE9483963.1 hypothetical protein [Xenorhabdus bovienii]MDE9552687.1 hypothetical protein [Xenorhabdus bovienii]MDE9557734.1 hypothetical protein [Xenorhabdus bovienii]MDE9566330.1 hypothetical protein [Xenorhabdus bovienii]